MSKATILFILFLCCSSSFSFFINSSNESGWEHVFIDNVSSVLPLNHYGSKSYYLGIQVKATYMQSMQFCENIHMKLLTIRSKEENDRIQKYTRETSKSSEHFWTSGAKLLDNRIWVWMSHGDGIQYTNWAIDEPNDDDESQCISLSSKNGILHWYDSSCDSRHYFICERSIDSAILKKFEPTLRTFLPETPPSFDRGQVLSYTSSNIGIIQYIDKRYFFSKKIKTTYLTAIQFCKLINMDLVTIESKDENDRIYNFIRNKNVKPNWWTSGTRLLDGQSWIWLTKGSHVEYTNWLPGQPDSDDEFCLQLVHQTDKGLFWQDSSCSEANYIICETTCSDTNQYCDERKMDKEESISDKDWSNKIRKMTPGSISFEYVGGQKFHVEDKLLATKSQAEIFCNYHNMKLLTILNKDENNVVKNLIQYSSGPFWTSARKLDGIWTWPIQFQQFSYSNWSSGKPESGNSNENCLAINRLGEWRKENCLTERHFICEMPRPVIDVRSSTDDQENLRGSQCRSEPMVNVYISNNIITEDGKQEVSQRFLSSEDIQYSDAGYHVHVKNNIETPGSERNNQIL